MLAALVISAPAYAECGTRTQCIAVGLTQTDALNAHHDLGAPKTPTMNFGVQPVASRTIYVAAVANPSSSAMVTLGPISISGPDAGNFSIITGGGGACSSTNGPVHNGAMCTITVVFTPSTLGVKTATVNVPLAPPPGCLNCITGRTITLTGGYDLTSDLTVGGTLAAQTETAQRFSRTQIVNFQHRMESLHGAGAGAAASSNLNAGATAGVLTQEVVSLITTQTVNLANLSDQGADGMSASAGLWAAGTANFGRRDATASRSGFRFSSDGISLGFDHRLSDQAALGVGVGLARDHTDIGNDGSHSRAKGYSIAGYGSFHPGRKIFVDGMIGAGSLNFETQRYVSAANAYAVSDRDGDQIFGSVSAGYEYRDDGLLVSPYARLDYARQKLKQGTESGTGTFDLSYASETWSSMQGALGVRAGSVHATRFGFAAPRIRAEYQHNFQDEHLASVAYVDPAGGAASAIPTGQVERNALIVGVGNDFVMRNGATFGVDYQILHTFSQDTNYAVLLQFTKDFNGHDFSTLLNSYTFSPLNGIQAEASYTFDDNVTRSNDSKLVDSSYGVNFGKTASFPLTDHMRMLLTGSVAGDRFHRYDGLSRLSGGVQGELQYRSSAQFSSATWGVFLRTFSDQYKSALRDGTRYSTGLSMRQPLTDRMRLFGALAHNRRNGKNVVFDHSDNSARLNLDYELNTTGTLYLGGEYRRGDVVTTATSSGIYSANVSVQDDAFADTSLFTYRLDGSTALATVGYNIGLGPRDSFDVSWRRIRSSLNYDSSSILAGYTAASNYTSNQYAISYMMRF